MGKTSFMRRWVNEDGNKAYGYGGDCGEIINADNFCNDGLVRPDRSFASGAFALLIEDKKTKPQKLRLTNFNAY